MSFENLMDHRCDLYHLTESIQSPGYGLPGEYQYEYHHHPDELDVGCHFAVKDSTIKTTQNQPEQMLEGRIKLVLPLGSPIRMNDKVVWKENQTVFISEYPRIIRNHHLMVYLKPETGIKGAI